MADKDDKDELPIKCNDATINNTACSSDEDDIVFQFKIIIKKKKLLIGELNPCLLGESEVS